MKRTATGSRWRPRRAARASAGAVVALTLAGVALTACSPASTTSGQTTLNFFQFKGEALADFE